MAKTLETKDFKFTLDKLDEEKGTFTGYASVFGVVDSYGDIVDKGAFKKTLKERKAFPILWSHNIMEPLGIVQLSEDETGLRIDKGELNLDVQRAREIRSLMKQLAVEGISIGYQTIKDAVDKDTKARHLKEVKLWEISPCVFPACVEATVDEIKSEALSLEEPPPGTPAEEPPDIKSKPEYLHLLAELNSELIKFNESLRR